MKKLFTFLLLFIALEANASHLIGGQIALKFIGRTGPLQSKYIYEVTITIFRDCLNGGADFDDPMKVAIYSLSNNDLLQNIEFRLTQRMYIPSFQTQQLCYEGGLYKKQIVVGEDFYLTSARCCRAIGYMNINTDFGYTLYTETHINSNPGEIPTPVYNSPIVVGNGNNLSFDISSPDSLSDSTTYEISNPLQGADKNLPLPDPSPPKSFIAVPYNAGYSLSNPIGNSNSISINRYNGILSVSTNTIGMYAIGITVTKYKNNMVLYKQVRDLTIVSCQGCVPLSVQNNETKIPGLKTFPNPAGNILNLNLEGYDLSYPAEVSIYSNEGRLIKKEILNKSNTIDISSFAKGIYLLQVRSNDKTSYTKFSKL